MLSLQFQLLQCVSRHQCFLRLMISLHLSANSHQSRQDGSFSCLSTSLPHMSQIPVSSSLHISTLPAQLGHGKYSGLGRRNFLMPGHDSELELVTFFSSPALVLRYFFSLYADCFLPQGNRFSRELDGFFDEAM